jgi:hypothetical protein
LNHNHWLQNVAAAVATTLAAFKRVKANPAAAAAAAAAAAGKLKTETGIGAGASGATPPAKPKRRRKFIWQNCLGFIANPFYSTHRFVASFNAFAQDRTRKEVLPLILQLLLPPLPTLPL